MSLEDLDQYCEIGIEAGAAHAKVIHPGTVVNGPLGQAEMSIRLPELWEAIFLSPGHPNAGPDEVCSGRLSARDPIPCRTVQGRQSACEKGAGEIT